MSSVREALDTAWQLYRRGEWQQAEQLYLQVLEVDPHQVNALNLLAVIAGQTGRGDRAIDYLGVVLRLRPWWAAAHNNMGNALIIQGRLAEAVASFQEAVYLQPDFVNAHVNLGLALSSLRKLNGAIAAFRTAMQLKPDDARTHSTLITTLNYHSDYDARAIQEECSSWNRRHAEPLRNVIQPHTNRPDPERRLRVGYVSSEFREHADSFFITPLLSNHDHEQWEIFCYANVARPDARTDRLRAYADVWRNTVGLTDERLADLVRSDQIDILVNLKLHTANNRLLMFARKPAPVQVAWCGYPGTTGLSAMDYRLTDPYLDPPGLFDAFYSEESVRLPETFWCYDTPTDEPSVNALPAGAAGFVMFGCLNTFSKVDDDCLQLWARVLRGVPQSRLLMLAPPVQQARGHVAARLQQEGISPSRVEFVARQPRPDYLRLYHRIDLALDPPHCNGHTTSLDAFWMGVPTGTLVSKKTACGRAGWSQLCNLGLKELAAETPGGFVELAVRLAGDLPRLQELRGSLRQRMQQSPLMDGKRFARHVEQAYRQMWHRWCQDPRRHEPA